MELAPVPVELDQVSYQYPGSNAWAIAQVSLSVQPRSFLAVVGPNGSGSPPSCASWRGAFADVGHGCAGRRSRARCTRGTSMVFQRPESQVLGVRARDDVVWGLPASPRPDVGALLSRVGLAGFEEREDIRALGRGAAALAIAACLARQPRLLISDEATAMIDGPGRVEVVALLESLAAAGITVIHVTHRDKRGRQSRLDDSDARGRVVPPSAAGSQGESGAVDPRPAREQPSASS